MKVNWDDYSQYFWENKKWQPNHQPEMIELWPLSSLKTPQEHPEIVFQSIHPTIPRLKSPSIHLEIHQNSPRSNLSPHASWNRATPSSHPSFHEGFSMKQTNQLLGVPEFTETPEINKTIKTIPHGYQPSINHYLAIDSPLDTYRYQKPYSSNHTSTLN